MMCQTWPNPLKKEENNSVCCANRHAAPSYASYRMQTGILCSPRSGDSLTENFHLGSGTDIGITMKVGGGDDCDTCIPRSRATAFTIICSDDETPKILSATSADPPSPISHVKIAHCSGCPTSDPRFCSDEEDDSVEILVDVQVIGAPTRLSLLPPPSPIKVFTQTGSDLILEGTIENALNNSISVVIISGSSTAAQGTLSFLPKDMVMLSLVDLFSGKQYPCGPGKAPLGKFVSLACTLGNNGVLVVSGSIL
jgi:hypothetical protein